MPEELLLNVAKFLPPLSLPDFGATCKLFARIERDAWKPLVPSSMQTPQGPRARWALEYRALELTFGKDAMARLKAEQSTLGPAPSIFAHGASLRALDLLSAQKPAAVTAAFRTADMVGRVAAALHYPQDWTSPKAIIAGVMLLRTLHAHNASLFATALGHPDALERVPVILKSVERAVDGPRDDDTTWDHRRGDYTAVRAACFDAVTLLAPSLTCEQVDQVMPWILRGAAGPGRHGGEQENSLDALTGLLTQASRLNFPVDTQRRIWTQALRAIREPYAAQQVGYWHYAEATGKALEAWSQGLPPASDALAQEGLAVIVLQFSWAGVRYISNEKLRTMVLQLARRCPPGILVNTLRVQLDRCFALIGTTTESERNDGRFDRALDAVKVLLLATGGTPAARSSLKRLFVGMAQAKWKHGAYDFVVRCAPTFDAELANSFWDVAVGAAHSYGTLHDTYPMLIALAPRLSAADAAQRLACCKIDLISAGDKCDLAVAQVQALSTRGQDVAHYADLLMEAIDMATQSIIEGPLPGDPYRRMHGEKTLEEACRALGKLEFVSTTVQRGSAHVLFDALVNPDTENRARAAATTALVELIDAAPRQMLNSLGTFMRHTAVHQNTARGMQTVWFAFAKKLSTPEELRFFAPLFLRGEALETQRFDSNTFWKAANLFLEQLAGADLETFTRTLQDAVQRTQPSDYGFSWWHCDVDSGEDNFPAWLAAHATMIRRCANEQRDEAIAFLHVRLAEAAANPGRYWRSAVNLGIPLALGYTDAFAALWVQLVPSLTSSLNQSMSTYAAQRYLTEIYKAAPQTLLSSVAGAIDNSAPASDLDSDSDSDSD